MKAASDPKKPRWLLLVHQIPPKPSYFRAKVGRRLQKIGAVAIKNSVYVLPFREQTQEDLRWVTREIVAEGGDATLCAASLIEGLRDQQVESLFQAAREADYASLAEEARQAVGSVPAGSSDDERRGSWTADLARLSRRLSEVIAMDFFAAPGREAAQAAVDALDARVRPRRSPDALERVVAADYSGRTWVTRKNVHVDRIASAWLVQRFIDPRASLKFVPGQGYEARAGEVTFDMFEADFTHVGDRCTFETLLERFRLQEAGLAPLAEIVHDIDIKDAKFGRAEAPGIASLVAGIALAHREDERRVEVGGVMLDALLELYRRRRP